MNAPALKEQATTGPVVAVQYPEKVEFREVADIAALATEYGPLVKIDADSASEYKKLCAGLKAVSKARLHIDKEESHFKDPANAFAKAVREYAKKIREPFATLEDNLKKEKKRVDDIQQEKLEAQKRLWNENLQIIRSRGQNLFGASMDQLKNELDIIDACDLGDFDFGELIEDAKAELANARIRTEQAIATEQQRIDLEAEKQRLAEEAEQRRIDDLKREIEQAEGAAYMEDENRTMRAKMAALEAAAKPAAKVVDIAPKEAVRHAGADSIMDMDDKKFAESIGMASGATVSYRKDKEPLVSHTPKASFDDEIVEPIKPVISDSDLASLNRFIERIKDTIAGAPVDFDNQNIATAVNRVVDSMSKANGFLAKAGRGE